MNKRGPTLEDVAREAGVSRATVSRVVNGIRNVDSEIQDLVRRAIRTTGYSPNGAARSLVTRRAETVALLVSGAGDSFAARVFADPFFGRVVNGAMTYLRRRDMHPVLMFAESSLAREQVVDYLRQGSADGALIVSIQADDPLPRMLVDARVPVVLFARPPQPLLASYVDMDHYQGGRLAAEHLLARGCRRLAVISAPHNLPAGRERLAGFHDALHHADRDPVPVEQGDFTLNSGAAAMMRLLETTPDLDGIFAANDLMAQGACQILREQGLRVPDDVAVVGFDDSTIATTCRPPLTTIRQPVEKMAATMAEMLASQLQGAVHDPTHMLFDPELVVRESA